MPTDLWTRLSRHDAIFRGLADELLQIAAGIHRGQQLAAALEASPAHRHTCRQRLAEIQEAKDEFRALLDDLQVRAGRLPPPALADPLRQGSPRRSGLRLV
jgi:hypothetical protein